MMALGVFRFSLPTAAYQQLQRTTEYKWAEHERAGASPLLQFTGEASDTITLNGTIYPGFRGGTGQIAQLRLMAGLGLPLPLISGTGNFFGLWCVSSIDEQQTVFWDNGTFRKQDFALTLKKYGEITVTIAGFRVSASGLLGAVL